MFFKIGNFLPFDPLHNGWQWESGIDDIDHKSWLVKSGESHVTIRRRCFGRRSMCVCDTSFEARFLSSQVVVDGGSQQVGRFRDGVGPLKKKTEAFEVRTTTENVGSPM